MKNRFNFWSAIAAEQEKTSMWRNLEKTKKTKNQNFLEKFWFQIKRCFFLVFLQFFWFFWFRFLKTKKNLGFFWFFEGSLTWSKAKNQKKLKVFLVFSWIVHTCILNIWPKNQKNLEFFWFFAFLQVRLPSNKPRCYPQQRLGNNASKENLHARLFPNT